MNRSNEITITCIIDEIFQPKLKIRIRAGSVLYFESIGRIVGLHQNFQNILFWSFKKKIFEKSIRKKGREKKEKFDSIIKWSEDEILASSSGGSVIDSISAMDMDVKTRIYERFKVATPSFSSFCRSTILKLSQDLIGLSVCFSNTDEFLVVSYSNRRVIKKIATQRTICRTSLFLKSKKFDDCLLMTDKNVVMVDFEKDSIVWDFNEPDEVIANIDSFIDSKGNEVVVCGGLERDIFFIKDGICFRRMFFERKVKKIFAWGGDGGSEECFMMKKFNEGSKELSLHIWRSENDKDPMFGEIDSKDTSMLLISKTENFLSLLCSDATCFFIKRIDLRKMIGNVLEEKLKTIEDEKEHSRIVSERYLTFYDSPSKDFEIECTFDHVGSYWYYPKFVCFEELNKIIFSCNYFLKIVDYYQDQKICKEIRYKDTIKSLSKYSKDEFLCSLENGTLLLLSARNLEKIRTIFKRKSYYIERVVESGRILSSNNFFKFDEMLRIPESDLVLCFCLHKTVIVSVSRRRIVKELRRSGFKIRDSNNYYNLLRCLGVVSSRKHENRIYSIWSNEPFLEVLDYENNEIGSNYKHPHIKIIAIDIFFNPIKDEEIVIVSGERRIYLLKSETGECMKELRLFPEGSLNCLLAVSLMDNLAIFFGTNEGDLGYFNLLNLSTNSSFNFEFQKSQVHEKRIECIGFLPRVVCERIKILMCGRNGVLKTINFNIDLRKIPIDIDLQSRVFYVMEEILERKPFYLWCGGLKFFSSVVFLV